MMTSRLGIFVPSRGLLVGSEGLPFTGDVTFTGSEMESKMVGINTHPQTITPYPLMRFRCSFGNVPVPFFAPWAALQGQTEVGKQG